MPFVIPAMDRPCLTAKRKSIEAVTFWIPAFAVPQGILRRMTARDDNLTPIAVAVNDYAWPNQAWDGDIHTTTDSEAAAVS